MTRGPKRDPNKEVTEIMREILQLRLSRGETQKEFAEVLGLSTLIISDWECGRRKPGKRSRKDIEKLKGGE